jgi:hypothetical protein
MIDTGWPVGYGRSMSKYVDELTEDRRRGVVVTRVSGDTLSAEQWFFDCLENTYVSRTPCLMLQEYTQWRRPSLRHRFTAESLYNHTNRRGTTCQDPPLPPDVADEAKQQYMETLQVQKWPAR